MFVTTKKIVLMLLAVVLLVSKQAYAFDAFQIKGIEFEGLDNISKGAALLKVPDVGETLEPGETVEIIQALLDSNFFKEVELFKDDTNDHLIIKVKEREFLSSLSITGNTLSAISLKDITKRAKLVKNYSFNPTSLDKVENELRFAYSMFGYYGVKITSEVEELDGNRVAVRVKIDEGKPGKIDRINIIGNKKFKEKRLLKQLNLSEKKNLLSLMFSSAQYSKQKFDADMELLRDFYLDEGYLEFKILSRQVSVNNDKNDVYITVNINEGQQFTIKEMDLIGDVLGFEKELEDILQKDNLTGKVYSKAKITVMAEKLADSIRNKGYLFARVIPQERINSTNSEVKVSFYVDPGKQYYINRIYFSGDNLTEDRVLRRYLQHTEGELASGKEIKDSKYKLMSSGYFKGVDVATEFSENKIDHVDIKYSLVPGGRSNFNLGLGYNSVVGLNGEFSFERDNLFGKGKNFGLTLKKSLSVTNIELDYIEPYFTKDGVSSKFGLIYSSKDNLNKTEDKQANKVSEYEALSLGTELGFGFPITLKSKYNNYVSFKHKKLTQKETSAEEIKKFLQLYGNQYNQFVWSNSISYSSLNTYLFPTSGMELTAAINVALPFSTLNYYTLVLNGKNYLTYKDYTWYIGGSFKYGAGYNNTQDLPFFENFSLYNGVRGYTSAALGPKDSKDNIYGGDLAVNFNTGLFLPSFFGFKHDSLRFSLFLDSGYVFDTNKDSNITTNGEAFDFSKLKYSVGFAVDWNMPALGPISVSIGFPLNSVDVTEEDRISFGRPVY